MKLMKLIITHHFKSTLCVMPIIIAHFGFLIPTQIFWIFYHKTGFSITELDFISQKIHKSTRMALITRVYSVTWANQILKETLFISSAIYLSIQVHTIQLFAVISLSHITISWLPGVPMHVEPVPALTSDPAYPAIVFPSLFSPGRGCQLYPSYALAMPCLEDRSCTYQ